MKRKTMKRELPFVCGLALLDVVVVGVSSNP
jgi:hypothetical protein